MNDSIKQLQDILGYSPVAGNKRLEKNPLVEALNEVRKERNAALVEFAKQEIRATLELAERQEAAKKKFLAEDAKISEELKKKVMKLKKVIEGATEPEPAADPTPDAGSQGG